MARNSVKFMVAVIVVQADHGGCSRKFTAAGCALLKQPVHFNKCLEGCKSDLASATAAAADSGKWDIRKKLAYSDVAGSVLRIGSKECKNHILQKMSPGHLQILNSNKLLRITVVEVDKNQPFLMILRKTKQGYFMISDKWQARFVERRNLIVNDKIRLRWKDYKCSSQSLGKQSNMHLINSVEQ